MPQRAQKPETAKALNYTKFRGEYDERSWSWNLDGFQNENELR